MKTALLLDSIENMILSIMEGMWSMEKSIEGQDSNEWRPTIETYFSFLLICLIIKLDLVFKKCINVCKNLLVKFLRALAVLKTKFYPCYRVLNRG